MERFWSKVNKNGPIPAHCPELGPCWVWTGATVVGYGVFQLKDGTVKAHRFSWLLKHGQWPEPCACHKCDNKPCVNPVHLFEGTSEDNNHDRWDKGGYPASLGNFRAGANRGSTNPLAKLTEAKVRLIRSSSASARQLAEYCGISPLTVHRVRRGDTWAHVHVVDADDLAAADALGALLSPKGKEAVQ